MSYIVKNCPATYLNFEDKYVCTSEIKEKEKGFPFYCKDCTDCVIKRVIEKCKYYQNKIGRTPQYRAGFVDATKDILQLFDIEEINK